MYDAPEKIRGEAYESSIVRCSGRDRVRRGNRSAGTWRQRRSGSRSAGTWRQGRSGTRTAGARRKRRGSHSRAARRRAALADGFVYVEEFLQGSGQLGKQALLPVQYAAAAFGVLAAPDRPQSAGVGFLGQLQHRSHAGEYPESLSLQDGQGTLCGFAGGG